MCCFSQNMGMRKETSERLPVYVLAVVTIVLLALSQLMIGSIASGMVAARNVQPSSAGTLDLSGMPKGIPDVYGQELGVSFDNVLASLPILSTLDGDLYEDGTLTYADLNQEQQQRYVRIGSSIACEFCCGATTMVFSNGQPSCACAHSAAMRGLTKYLLINHPDMSDEQILDELVKWKTLFFPKQMLARASSGTGSAQAIPDMVGGC